MALNWHGQMPTKTHMNSKADDTHQPRSTSKPWPCDHKVTNVFGKPDYSVTVWDSGIATQTSSV